MILTCSCWLQVTVERRLYDIGSILSSANLIKKSYLGRKRCAMSRSAPICRVSAVAGVSHELQRIK
jgi:hypothetical protein